ncbi:MAG: hypothetical protein WCS03_02660 [Bacteroidota bacterium]
MESFTDKNASTISKKIFTRISKSLNYGYNNFYLKLLFVSLASFTILFGINLSPDGFVYMEAANNSLSGNGFVINCNNISASVFQPLYSYAMIPFIYFLGYSTLAIFLFHLFLFILTYYIYDKLLSNTIKGINPVVKYLSIIISIYPFFTILLSESLLIALLGLYLNTFFFYKGKIFFKYFFTYLLLIAIFLTKNSAILLIIPIHLSLVDFKKKNWFLYYLKHFIFFVSLVLIFLIVKIFLKSTDSHQFILGGGLYSLKEYLIQIYRDISVGIFGRSFMHIISDYGLGLYFNILSISLLAFVYITSKVKIRNRLYLFLVYALVIHLFVFCNMYIDGELNGRFLFWFNLVFIFFIISELNRKYIRIIFLLIVIMNFSNIAYSRYKTIKPYDLKDVIIKLNYSLDSGTFYTEEARYPSLIYDKNSQKYIILSPAYPSWIEKFNSGKQQSK